MDNTKLQEALLEAFGALMMGGMALEAAQRSGFDSPVMPILPMVGLCRDAAKKLEQFIDDKNKAQQVLKAMQEHK